RTPVRALSSAIKSAFGGLQEPHTMIEAQLFSGRTRSTGSCFNISESCSRSSSTLLEGGRPVTLPRTQGADRGLPK
ncbi:unnamed protein product, partial [Musa banksii]